MHWLRNLNGVKPKEQLHLEVKNNELEYLEAGSNIVVNGKDYHIMNVDFDKNLLSGILTDRGSRESINVQFTVTGGSRRRKRVSRKRKCKKSYKRKTYCKRRRLIKSTNPNNKTPQTPKTTQQTPNPKQNPKTTPTQNNTKQPKTTQPIQISKITKRKQKQIERT